MAGILEEGHWRKLRAQTDETSGADQNRGPSARSLGKRPGNTMAPRS